MSELFPSPLFCLIYYSLVCLVGNERYRLSIESRWTLFISVVPFSFFQTSNVVMNSPITFRKLVSSSLSTISLNLESNEEGFKVIDS